VSALGGRVALVTGAGRGIGLAIAEVLHDAGASVVIADSGTGIDGRGADPEIARAAVRQLGERADAFTESIASPSAAKAAVELAMRRFGGIDILVNNAAILRDAFVFRAEPESWDAVLRTNLSAAFYTIAAATPLMREAAKTRPPGRIVNIVSTAGLYGNYGQAAYAAAKAGLVGLTRVTALDMARSKITCNAVAPFAATRVTESIKPANEAQVAYKERAMKVPARAVAELVAFLAGPDAGDISGQVFGTRAREIFLFSQPRPSVRLVREGALGAAVAAALKPHFVPLETDLEAFATDPVL
jgi:NAD(P)-dependent dehydrogenase (short-subunit alcohol dehydrogenase family)